jgi:hypothetical protein
MEDCAWPVPLPNDPLTQQRMEELWGRDNLNHIDCATRFAILRDYILQRDGALRAK